MAIRLQKGQRINLEKSNGSKLTRFCVGCRWGDVIKKSFFGLKNTILDVDLDLSCMMFDKEGKAVDYIWSPLYNFRGKLPKGKLTSYDYALEHTGDNLHGGGIDDNEVITVDLSKVNPAIESIVFFLNIYNNNDYSGDFSGIPYAYIRMFEPEIRNNQIVGVKENFAQYDVATKTDCIGMRGLILGKLYKHNSEWKFAAIGDAFPDKVISQTILRVGRDYSR